MPLFENATHFSILDSTFNDIAGDVVIINNAYYRLSPHQSIADLALTRHGSASNVLEDAPIPIPTTRPYIDLIVIIEKIRDILLPLDKFMSTTRVCTPLRQQLDELRISAAFAGRMAELLEGTELCPASWIETVRTRVNIYEDALRKFHDRIDEYRKNLESTLTGPAWRRIIWFILVTISGPTIDTIVPKMVTDIEQYRKPLEQVLTLFHK